MSISTFHDRYGNSGALDEFTLEESVAFADLAMLVVMVDREESDEELETFGEQLLSLAFEDPEELEAAYADRGESIHGEITSILGDQRAVDSFIRERAASIRGGAHREQALEMLATLAYADGVEPSEKDLCFRIGRAFGFPSEMVEVTFDEALGD